VLIRYLGWIDATKLQSFFRRKIETSEYIQDKKLGMTCDGCKNLISSTTTLLKKVWEKQFFSFLLKYCQKSQPSLECQDVINIYGAIIYDSIYNHYINPDFTCSLVLLVCPATEGPQNITQFVQRVLADKPKIPLPTPTKKSTFKVLQVTDIHIDPYYKESAIVNCGKSICCREISKTTTANNGPLSGYWGTSEGGCDLPFRTVEQMANFIKKNVEVDFVLWTGDNSQHDINKTSDENLNNTESLTTLFMNALQNVPFYPALGNHETFPLEVWNFQDNPTVYADPTERAYQKDQEKFEATLSSDWKPWIGTEGAQQFAKNGFYSTYNEKFGVRIVSMNTNACHNENFYLLLDPTDPGGMLGWFEETMRKSEKDGESVYIIGHIAPSSTDCFTQWSTRFSALVERFSHIIRGQFFGHTHSDSFLIYKSFLNPSETVQLGWVAPSMTTNSHRNPSFRVFEVDADTKIPVNYYQYRLNLTHANSQKPNEDLQWDIAYDFLGEYGYKDLSLSSYDNLRDKIWKDQNILKKFATNYATGTGSSGSNTGFYCALLSTYDQNIACLKNLNITVPPNTMNDGLALLSGVWINKTIAISE